MARFLIRQLDPYEVLFFIRWRGAPGTAEVRRWFATDGVSVRRALGILYANGKIIAMGLPNGGVHWILADGKRGRPSVKAARAVAAKYRLEHPDKLDRIRRQAAEAHAIDGILRDDAGAMVTAKR